MSQFLTRVQDNCRRYPDRIAFTDDFRQMTFKELWTESGKVSSWLLRQNLKKNEFCQIVLPRSASSMASILGVLRAGGAFCNLDSKYPAERILFTRMDLGTNCVLEEETYKKIQETESPMEGYVESDPHDAAFVIYTSGSTGRPKGVIHEYGNVDLCLTLYPEQSEYPEAHACLTAPFYSVASVLLAINCMSVARTTHIVSELLLRDINRMSQFLVDNQIEDTFLPPSYVRLYKNPSPYLKRILTGAEKADGIYYEGGKPEILNYYSMSEAGFPLLIFPINRKYSHTPVGVPIVPGIDLHLEAEDGTRIEGAGEGEICFTNRFVRGYLNLPDKTAEAFKGEVFHTGDIARRDENGLYYIVGRKDDMFNISGNRVEPGEVEAVFKRITGIPVCFAKGFEDQSGAFICLYYQGDIEQDNYSLRQALSEELPDYMIPSYFVKLDHIPTMEHGKVDRAALPDPRKTVARPAYEAPQNKIEKALCKTIGKVLDVNPVGVNDDFLALGGSSIAAIDIISKAGLEGLSIVDIYKGHTIRGIAELYQERMQSRDGLTEEEREDIERKNVQYLTLPQDVVMRRSEHYPHSTNHLYPAIISFPKLVSAKKIQKVLAKVMKHHAIFGTVFGKDENGTYIQRYDASSVRIPEIEQMSDAELNKMLEGPFEPFDLFNEPLARARVISTESGAHAFLIYHHLIFDGNSLQLIADNFTNAFMGKPLKTDTYFSFLKDENQLRNTPLWNDAIDYFKKNYDGTDWCWDIPHDIHEEGDLPAQRPIPTVMTKELLSEMEKRSGTTRGIFCGAALLLTLAKLSRNSRVLISSFFHDRTDHLRQNAAGLVSSHVAVGVDLTECRTLKDLYNLIEKKTAEGIEHCVYDWCAVNSQPYVTEPIDLVYDTPEINSRENLTKLGVKVTELDPHWDKNMKISYLMVFETDQDVSLVLMYTKTLMSDALIDTFADTYASFVEKMIHAEDPSTCLLTSLI